MGLRLEYHYAGKGDDHDDFGVPNVLADVEHTIRLFGVNFDADMSITFTTKKGKAGGDCLFPATTDEFHVSRWKINCFDSDLVINY